MVVGGETKEKRKSNALRELFSHSLKMVDVPRIVYSNLPRCDSFPSCRFAPVSGNLSRTLSDCVCSDDALCFVSLLEKDALKRGGERQVEESMDFCIVVVCVSILSARARIKVTQEVSLGGVTRVFRVHVAE